MKIIAATLDLFAPPLGFGIILKILLNRGYQIKIINLGNREKALKEALDFNPDIVLASLFTGSHRPVIDFMKTIKGLQSTLTMVGGPHATFFPEVIEKNDCIDVLCRGEGDIAIEEFFNQYEENGKIPEKIQNLYIRKDNQIIKNDSLSLEYSLDKFPYIERRIFYEIYPHMKENPIEWFITSRGCPFQCSYCFNHQNELIFGKSWRNVRYRTPENIVGEIQEVLKYKKIDFIEFHDDMFGLQKDWVAEFAKLYREKINIPFRCNIIPALISEERIKTLSSANLKVVNIGIQTFNERIRFELLNRKGTNKQIIDAIKIIKKYNLKVITESMLGLPETTIQDDLDTLKFNHDLGVDFAWASILQPYPKTALADYMVQHNIWDGDIDHIPASFHFKSVLNFPEKQKNQIFVLHAFFSLTVRFYFLVPFVKFLYRFKPLSIYKILRPITQATLLNFRVYKTNYMLGNIIKMLPSFFKRTFNRMKNIS